MKNIALLALIGFLFIQSVVHKPERKIEYVVSDEIKKEIRKAIKEIKVQNKKYNVEITDDEFYVHLGQWNLDTLYLHIDEHHFSQFDKKLYNRTNRFLKVSKNINLPIIFDYDEYLSSVYKTEDGAYYMINNHGGRWIFIDKRGEYLRE